MEAVEYAGWHCARVVSGDIEALVTLDVGPRVIRLGKVGGPNLFYEKEHERGLRGGDQYRGYGGHRLWIAPEHPELTYAPDNDSVGVADGWFSAAADGRGLIRSIRITPLQAVGAFRVEHRLQNAGIGGATAAPWALSVMRPGGTCVFPRAKFAPHGPTSLLPTDSLALWSYTDLSDARLVFGQHLVALQQPKGQSPTKIGAFVPEGWAAYFLPAEGDSSEIFLKTFPSSQGTYPDRGCNFECFSRHDMLEVESLGQLRHLEPGNEVVHEELWSVSIGRLPTSESSQSDTLSAIAGRLQSAQIR